MNGMSSAMVWLETRKAVSRNRAKKAEILGFAVGLPLSAVMALAMAVFLPELLDRQPALILFALAPAVFMLVNVLACLIEVRRIDQMSMMVKAFDELTMERK